jgi:Na+/melibiose symporter-like transporter
MKSIRTLIDNKPFLRLLSAWFINGIANGIPAVLFFLYLENILGTTESQRAIYITLYFGSTVLAMPFWLHLSKLVGKHKIWCWAMSIAIVTFVSVIFIPEGSFIYFGIICIITGMCLGADLSLPPAIQADVVDYDTLKFRKQRAGLLFSLWGMSTKLALAISVGFAFPTLEILGFNAGDPTEQGKIALILIYALVPVILKVIAVVIIWNFPLDARRHDMIIRRLKRILDHELNETFIKEKTKKKNSSN